MPSIWQRIYYWCYTIMMQFNEKDVNRMIRACEYYAHWVCGNHPTGYMKEEYSHLLKKLHNYESQIDCPDCKCCAIHS